MASPTAVESLAMTHKHFLHRADSGSTLRLFPAGGATESADWLALSHAARTHADGNVYLAAHGAIELHGVHSPEDAADALDDAPLLSAPTPILASPLSTHARQLARTLASQWSAAESALPFRIGIDAGDGDILAQHPDIALLLGDTGAQLHIHGQAQSADLSDDAAVEALREAIDEESEKTDSDNAEEAANGESAAVQNPPIGWLADHLPAGRVDLGAGLHRGILPADFAELIGRLKVDITVTPWQGVIFHDIADGDADVVLRVLAPRGFIFDVNSPLL